MRRRGAHGVGLWETRVKPWQPMRIKLVDRLNFDTQRTRATENFKLHSALRLAKSLIFSHRYFVLHSLAAAGPALCWPHETYYVEHFVRIKRKNHLNKRRKTIENS
jgi:hypothetical protein